MEHINIAKYLFYTSHLDFIFPFMTLFHSISNMPLWKFFSSDPSLDLYIIINWYERLRSSLLELLRLRPIDLWISSSCSKCPFYYFKRRRNAQFIALTFFKCTFISMFVTHLFFSFPPNAHIHINTLSRNDSTKTNFTRILFATFTLGLMRSRHIF